VDALRCPGRERVAVVDSQPSSANNTDSWKFRLVLRKLTPAHTQPYPGPCALIEARCGVSVYAQMRARQSGKQNIPNGKKCLMPLRLYQALHSRQMFRCHN
jgi:hypothetical protein